MPAVLVMKSIKNQDVNNHASVQSSDNVVNKLQGPILNDKRKEKYWKIVSGISMCPEWGKCPVEELKILSKKLKIVS